MFVVLLALLVALLCQAAARPPVRPLSRPAPRPKTRPAPRDPPPLPLTAGAPAAESELVHCSLAPGFKDQRRRGVAARGQRGECFGLGSSTTKAGLAARGGQADRQTLQLHSQGVGQH